MLLKLKQGKYFERNYTVEKHPTIYLYSKEMNGDKVNRSNLPTQMLLEG